MNTLKILHTSHCPVILDSVGSVWVSLKATGPGTERHSMKFSVIIPYLNAADTIRSTLDALLDQSWPSDWEVIIANNGSTDALEPIVASYSSTLPSVKILDASAKRGAAYARNVAVAASSGDRLLFCDADDVPGRAWASAMASALNRHPFIAARFEFQKLNSPSTMATRGGTQVDGLQICHFLPFPHAGAGSIGISRQIHDSIGGFDENILIAEDADYCMRVQLSGHKLVFVPDAVLHYRLRGNQTETFVQAFRYAKHAVRLYKQYGKRSSSELWRWRAYVQSWGMLLQRIPGLARTEQGRTLLTWRLATHIGALRGSLRFGVPPVMAD